MRNLINKMKMKILSSKGSADPIITIIFAAIIILAVIAVSPTIQSVFTNMATKFSVWMSSKLDALFT